MSFDRGEAQRLLDEVKIDVKAWEKSRTLGDRFSLVNEAAARERAVQFVVLLQDAVDAHVDLEAELAAIYES